MKKYLSVLLFFFLSIFSSYAQQKIKITLRSGEVKEFFVSDIDNMSFYKYEVVGIEKLSLSLSKNSIEVNQNFTLNAVVEPADAQIDNVKWVPTDESVLQVIPSSKNPLSCTVKGLKAGQTDLSIIINDTVKKSCTVTVTEQVIVNHVISVSISNINIKNVGEKSSALASIYPIDATNKDCTWKIDDESIASVYSTDKNSASILAKKKGSTRLTVTTVDGNKSASCTITVGETHVTPDPTPGGSDTEPDTPVETEVKVSSITITNQQITLNEGESQILTASVKPDNATNKALNWTSSNTNVATVNANGLVTAKSMGEAEIKATAKDGSKVYGSCIVKVEHVDVPVTVSVSAASGVNTNSASVTLVLTGTTDNVLSYGIVYGEEEKLEYNPQAGNYVIAQFNGTKQKVFDIENLSVHTDYYYRGFVIDGEEIKYSDGYMSFTTLSSDPYPVATQMVDLGLHVKWANYNMGAQQVADYGKLFSWGDYVGNARGALGYPSDASSYKQNLSGTKYDIATVKWKGQWHTPTQAEWKELYEKCNWTRVTNYKGTGISGSVVTSKDPQYTDELFLPNTGNYFNQSTNHQGSKAYYWSGDFNANDNSAAYVTYTTVKDGAFDTWEMSYQTRYMGMGVRPVYGEIYNGGDEEPEGGWESEDAAEAVDFGPAFDFYIASYNLGAEKPEDVGKFYSWGETSPKSRYSRDNYEASFITIQSGYCFAGDKEFDAAAANWGGGWQTPTRAQMDYILKYGNPTWTTLNGVEGFLLKSTYNGNSVFLPATGYKEGEKYNNNHLYFNRGYYWCSDFDEDDPIDGLKAYGFPITEGSIDGQGTFVHLGYCIRPVKPKKLKK